MLPTNRPRWILVSIVLVAAWPSMACRSTPSSAPAVSADTWAVVDGRNISRQDVDAAFRRTQNAAQPLSDEETLTAKLNLLDELIVQDILLAKATQLKLEVAQSEIDTAYAETRRNVPDDAFQRELNRRGLTPGDVREGLRRELLAQKVIAQEVSAKVAVADKEVADFFGANRAQFNIPEEAYHIAQIAVTPVRDAQVANRNGDDATTPEAAAAKIRMLMERLQGGTSFEELAASYSEDPASAPRGGDLGFVPVSRLQQAPPSLRNAVLNKAPGTISVVSAEGAHTIVLVVAHEMAGQRDLSTPAVREQITQALRGRKEQLLRTAYLTTARSDAKIVNYLARRLVESQGKPPSLPLSAPAAKQP
jgi:peptidyl-prolyl cis-trans isomerase SurA